MQVLEGNEDAWIGKVFDEIYQLEETYAVALDAGRKTYLDEERQRLDKATREIRRLVDVAGE